MPPGTPPTPIHISSISIIIILPGIPSDTFSDFGLPPCFLLVRR